MNIDHVATLRQARGGHQPDPADAARACEAAGANGITAHLREDRRHVQDSDVRALRKVITTYFNLELACLAEMIDIACAVLPDQVTLVPERREEITTEGGLDLGSDPERIRNALTRLRGAGIRTSLFIDPTLDAVQRSVALGADALELHTGAYSNSPGDPARLRELREAAARGGELGISVHAGHGLTAANLGPVCAIPEVEELNIGHSIVARAVLTGIEGAVREVMAAMGTARAFDATPPPP